MTEYAWIIVAILLLVPSLVVGFLRFGLKKKSSAISGSGGIVFSLMTFAVALWIIVDKVS